MPMPMVVWVRARARVRVWVWVRMRWRRGVSMRRGRLSWCSEGPCDAVCRFTGRHVHSLLSTGAEGRVRVRVRVRAEGEARREGARL